MLLKNSPLLIDGFDQLSETQRRPLSDEELQNGYADRATMDIVARPANILDTYLVGDRIGVTNSMALGELGISGKMQVHRAGRAEITLDTVPPLEMEGKLVRLDGNSAPKYQELPADQLTFVPDSNAVYRIMDFSGVALTEIR